MIGIGANLIIPLLFFVLLIGLAIFFQIKLSRNENKNLGLILPIIFFVLSLLLILGMGVFLFKIPSPSNEGIQSIEEVISTSRYIYLFLTFITTNISTVVLGGIYIIERNKIKAKKTIEKIKIEDL